MLSSGQRLPLCDRGRHSGAGNQVMDQAWDGYDWGVTPDEEPLS